MHANEGDHITVRGHHVGDADREGVIVEVHGADGTPPYIVHWTDGHEGLFFPGADAAVEHATQPRPAP